MELKARTIEELKKIVEKDYGVFISNAEANKLGLSLLRLTRLATAALARTEEQKLELVRTLPYHRK